jgi:nicotinamidase/pyrazinamidase
MKAFVIVDMQNDFMPGRALGVAGADQLASLINSIIPRFSLVVASQDWHPLDHVSFAKNHPGKVPGDIIKVDHQEQVLWPVHCVRDTTGAELVSDLNKQCIASIFYKGTDSYIDSYSSFFDNSHQKSTGLGAYLKSRGVTDVYFAGLATDYCILYSALDVVDLGFSAYVIIDACRSIHLFPKDEELALAGIAAGGGKIITSKELDQTGL